MCCGPCGCKESDTTKQVNNNNHHQNLPDSSSSSPPETAHSVRFQSSKMIASDHSNWLNSCLDGGTDSCSFLPYHLQWHYPPLPVFNHLNFPAPASRTHPSTIMPGHSMANGLMLTNALLQCTSSDITCSAQSECTPPSTFCPLKFIETPSLLLFPRLSLSLLVHIF